MNSLRSTESRFQRYKQLKKVVAVGDGANDLKMMAIAGLSVAFNAKPKVQEQASVCINHPSLLNLLSYFGLDSLEKEKLFV